MAFLEAGFGRKARTMNSTMNSTSASSALRHRPTGLGKGAADVAGAAGGGQFRGGRSSKHGELKRIAKAPCTGLLRVASGLVSLYVFSIIEGSSS
jgi:hypothetical protein